MEDFFRESIKQNLIQERLQKVMQKVIKDKNKMQWDCLIRFKQSRNLSFEDLQNNSIISHRQSEPLIDYFIYKDEEIFKIWLEISPNSVGWKIEELWKEKLNKES